jgi:hypothetical protein
MDANETVDKEILNYKRDILIQQYFEKTEKSERSVDNLINFLSDPKGNTLYNKIIRILDDSPPDYSLLSYLSSSLAFIVFSDFQSLFETHKFVLSQIEILTPQSLAILSDHNNWPEVPFFNGINITGQGVPPNQWIPHFTNLYSSKSNFTDKNLKERLMYCIQNLVNENLMIGKIAVDKIKFLPTKIGAEIITYLNYSVKNKTV